MTGTGGNDSGNDVPARATRSQQQRQAEIDAASRMGSQMATASSSTLTSAAAPPTAAEQTAINEIAEMEEEARQMQERIRIRRAAAGLHSTGGVLLPGPPSSSSSSSNSNSSRMGGAGAPAGATSFAPEDSAVAHTPLARANVCVGAAPAQMPRPRDPAAYDGRALGSSVLDWLDDIQAIADSCFPIGTDEATIVRWVSGYLSKDALKWWKLSGAKTRTHTWNQFATEVRERFAPAAQANAARTRIRALRQGAGPDGLSKYISQFQTELDFLRDMSEQDRMFEFTEGLHSVTAREVERVQPEATTLGELIARAIKADATENKYKRRGEAPAQRRVGHSAANAPGGAGVSSLAAAETDDDNESGGETGGAPTATLAALVAAAVTSALAKRGKGNKGKVGKGKSGGFGKRLTEEERKEHFAKDLCFGCHKAGHRKADCPERTDTGKDSSEGQSQSGKE